MDHSTEQQRIDRVHNPHHQFESYEYLRDYGACSVYPLIVDNAGNSVWHKDVSMERRNSGVRALEFITAGNCRLVQNGREYLVEPGMMFIQHKGAAIDYSVGPAGFLHKRWVGIQGDLADPILHKYGLLDKDVFTLRDPHRFVAITKQAHRMLRSLDIRFYPRLSLLAYEVLLTVGGDIAGPQYPPPIEAAVRHMHRSIFQPLSVPALASLVGLSTRHFYQLFREHVGDTPSHYFTALRLRHAAHLLAHTNRPVKEIVDTLGYNEPAYFSGQFRRVYGMSPRGYRMSFRKG